MRLFNDFLEQSLYHSSSILEMMKNNKKVSTVLSTITSIFIYFVCFFTIFPSLFGESFYTLGSISIFFSFIFFVLLSFVKIFLYSFILSQKTKQFIDYQEIFLINTVSNVPLMLFSPLIFVISEILSGQLALLLFIFLAIHALRIKMKLFVNYYQISGQFVYVISFVQWFVFMPIIFIIMIQMMWLGLITMIQHLFF